MPHHLLTLFARRAGNPALAYTNKVLALSPIGYWPFAEPSGTTALDASGNGRDGVYTNVTLGAAGIGDGRTAASFTTGSVCNVFSASLQGAFNGAEGTIAQWVQVSDAGVWSDATIRGTLEFFVNGSNVVRLRRTTTNNQIAATYVAGGTSKSVTQSAFSPTAWFHIALTWSLSGDAFKFFLNGAQVGATQTGLGTFVGSLSATNTVLGAVNSAAANPWSGNLAHSALWARPLTAAEITSIATL